MGLKLILGASGTGKSEYVYKLITKEAGEHRDKRYFVIVPDQFTMQTQLDMVEHSPGKGIMNIDVLSFSRLAHRIFEETNAVNRMVLDDTGKSLILRKLVSDIAGELPYLSGNLKRTGFIHEVKSSISEFMQYGIGREQLEELIRFCEGKGALKAKLMDLSVLYCRFLDYIGDSYITTEESMDLLAAQLGKSSIIKDSVVVFDGFTGFTPVQMRVLSVLVKLCDSVYITLTLEKDKIGCEEKIQELYAFTAKSYATIMRMAESIHAEVEIKSDFDINYRFAGKKDLLYLEKKIFRNLSKDDVFPDKPEHLQLYEARSIQQEARHVAQSIRELVVAGEQYRNIAVVTGNLGDYENHIVREFAKYDIPVYMDKTRAIVLNPIVEFTKSILQMIRKNFDGDSVCRFLRTGIGNFDLDEVDSIENYILRTGLRGKKKYIDFDSRKEALLADRSRNLSEDRIRELEVSSGVIKKILDIVDPLLCRNISSSGEHKAADYVEGLYQCLIKVDAYSGLKRLEERFRLEGNYTAEKEYSQIYRLTMELLEQIHGLLGEEKIGLEEFSDILEAGFEEITVGTIPQSVDKVIVGDIERSRLKPVKYLFFMGLNDNNIPKKGGKASILSDLEREFLASNESHLELSPTPHQKMYIQRFYLYSNLVKPSEKLFLSYSGMNNEGKSLRAAYIVAMIRRMYPALECEKEEANMGLMSISNSEELKDYICTLIRKNGECELSEEEHEELMKAMRVLLSMDEGYKELLELFVENSFFRYEGSNLDNTIAGILYGETLLASISRMEQFARCAYSYFLRYGLSLRERESYSVDNRDMGTIFHETLKRFGEELERNGKSWFDIEDAEVAEILDRELRNICEDTALFDSKANEYIYKRMSRVMRKAVAVLGYQLKQGRYQVADLELAFSRHQVLDEVNVALSVQEKMEVNGRIDRIDTMTVEDKVYVKVIDYKTGEKDFSLINFYQGNQLQLVVYLAEAMKEVKRKNKDKEVIPGALLYYHLADKTVKLEHMEDEESINAKIRDSLKTKGLINDDSVNVEGISGITSGKSDVVPVSFNKDGSYSKNSSVMNEQDLKLLQDFAQYKLRNIGDEIILGKKNCNPLKESDDISSCTYCSYRGVCSFEERLEGYSMTSLKKEDDEVILSKMKLDMETE